MDEGYVIGFLGAGGMYLPGKSAKWCVGRQLMDWMEDVGGNDAIGGHVEQDLDQERRRGERRRASLYGCVDQDIVREEMARDDWAFAWEDKEAEDEEKPADQGVIGIGRSRPERLKPKLDLAADGEIIGDGNDRRSFFHDRLEWTWSG